MKKLKLFLYRIKVNRTKKLFRESLLRTKNVAIDSQVVGYQNVFYEGCNAIPARCQFIGNDIAIGFRSTLGYNNLLSGAIKIGKYCQIGVDVAFHASNHPISHLTTYINASLFNGALKKNKQENKITIGNDVWIGHGVIVVGNVTIGNGAIVAAGSVVTKNVAPYAVVAGVPAKEVKKRFSEAIIQEIEALHWWDLSEQELEKIKPLFFKDFKNKDSIYE